jgi:hypothetical protein
LVLVENLTSSEAAADPEFSPLAKRLVDAVAVEMRKEGPGQVCSWTISSPPRCELMT